ncbi:MAG: hypothetical protein GF409_06720 [Candidatus Omnitrophica bacterium]|nr:hypothetical protein [Candidatus Omnitrophota bacterium]
MPYDRDLDEQLFAKSWENEDGRLTVCIYSYNNGPKKIQINRENKNAQGEYRFAKLGRVTKEEMEGILPLIQDALKEM